MPSTHDRSKHAAGLNTALFKILSNPLRGRIMVVLRERPASPSELAKMLDESLGNTSYHVREMAKAGVIELVDTKPGERGGPKRIYKAIALPVIDLSRWETLPRLVREVNSAWVAQLIIADLIEAIEARTFDARTGRTMIRQNLILDEEGWNQLESAAEKYIDHVLTIAGESATRRSKTGEEGFHVSASALAFETPPPAGDSA